MIAREGRPTLDPEFILAAYRSGYFPMADSRTGAIAWYSPDPRAIIPIPTFKISRSFRRVVRNREFEIRVNTSFQNVVRECARRADTWISNEIINAYARLHKQGHAHSVESWQRDELTGGLYGVAIGGAFFGESMFSHVSNGSKAALVYLVELLKLRGFRLLDSQFMNDHIKQFGAIELPRQEYLRRLSDALAVETRFP